ncbi:MAG: hypothetical protein JXR37_19035 [Kiritimatiellae bacterium]|nr:hypothetical protein [Kiritimatiellia bacterium]
MRKHRRFFRNSGAGQKAGHALLLAGLAVTAATWCNTVWSAIPAAAKADPRFALGYVVVTHYPGVRADGTGDATAGLQAAIEDAYDAGLAVLFAAGTYRISDTLKCYEWNMWDAKRGKARNPDRRNHILVGSTLGANRPLIKLARNAPRFGDPANPRPMLAYRVFSATSAQGTECVEPDDPLLGAPPNFKDQPNILFHSELRGIDFDCGGNPGAVGVAFRAAQVSSIEDVTVRATGASAGFRGIPGRNGGAANIAVEGGRYGIDLIDGGLAGTIAVGVHLTGQTEQAIRTCDFGVFTMVGFHIAKAAGPVAVVQDRMPYNPNAAGTLCLIDGEIELERGGVAFDNAKAAKSIYLRNVYVKGTRELVKSGEQPTVAGADGWSRIVEYAYTDPRTPPGDEPYANASRQNRMLNVRVFSVIDGEARREPEPVRAIEPNAAPPPADLVRRHVWTSLPSCEGQNNGTKVVTRPPYNAVANDDKDDRAAIQAAIDDAEAAGHGRVFLPAGTFEIGGTLTLRAKTKLFGVGRQATVIACHESWCPATGEPAMVRTVNDAEAQTTLAFLTLNARTIGGGTNALGAHACDRFNPVHWRAGRRSSIIAINVSKEWHRMAKEKYTANPHDYYKFTDHGGGRHYFLAPSWRWLGRNPDCRAVRIAGTREPLSIYGLNLEFTAGNEENRPRAEVEMTNAANVRIYSIKREMRSPTLVARDCRNIGVFGHGRMGRPFEGSGGQFQFYGNSTDLTIGFAVQDSAHRPPNGEPLLREHLAGGKPVELLCPDALSVYKRGELDDAAMW